MLFRSLRLVVVPDVGVAAPEGGFLLRAELGGGSAGGGTRPRRLVSFMASYRRARGVGDMCAGLMAVWSVLLGRLRGLRLIAGRKPCPGCWPGPTTATPSGAASFLKASSRRCSPSPRRVLWGKPQIPCGIGRGGAPTTLSCWGLALDVPPARGTCGEMVVGGGDFRLRPRGARPWNVAFQQISGRS